MSSQQMKQAVRERRRYALCCIDCTGNGCHVAPDATAEEIQQSAADIIANTYVHTDIGDRLNATLESLVREEDTEVHRTLEDNEHHIAIYSNLTSNIPYYVFVRGQKFKDFIEELRINLRKAEVYQSTN